MILLGITVATVLWANPANPYVWIVLGVTLASALIGFYDDYLKVTRQTHAGFSGKLRLVFEVLVAVAACYCDLSLGRPPFATSLAFPFFKDWSLRSAGSSWCSAAFIIVGAGNAVNLTDGLDGLAIVPVMIAALSFGLIAYLAGNCVVRRLSADPLCRRHRRARGAVRRRDRRGTGLPLVQRAAGLDLHGRHRLAGARRHARLDRGRHQARDRAGDRSAGCSCWKRCR